MGCTTNFKGTLKFKKELTSSQLAYLNNILGEDCREHPEWNTTDLYHIDLKLSDDFSGMKWKGTEKTYDMDKLVNVVIREMRKQYPEFAVTGKFVAQGEDIDDRWELVIENGFAVKKEISLTGKIIECPHCGKKFEYTKE